MPTTYNVIYSANQVQGLEPKLEAKTGVILGASQTLQAGTLVAQKTADGKFYAYASGASDGTQNPLGVVEIDCSSDSSGNMYYGLSASSDIPGVTYPSVAMIFKGVFNLSELWYYNGGTPIEATTAEIIAIPGGRVVVTGPSDTEVSF